MRKIKDIRAAIKLRDRVYKSLYGDRVWLVRGQERMLVELKKHSYIKNIGFVFYGLPLEIYTKRSDYRHGEILIKNSEMMELLQHSDNKAVANKLENTFSHLLQGV